MSVLRKLLRLAARQGGYSLVELLTVTLILGTVMGGLTTLFVRALNAEVDMNRRFRAQQDARIAIDRMRREIHCANSITPTGTSASITVTLPAQCPTAGGSPASIVYDTQLVSANRYQLRRAGVRLADYVTIANVFQYSTVSQRLATLRVTLPINMMPSDAAKEWRLVADIVLRNAPRSP